MKKRLTFVSNSSSSSYVTGYTTEIKKIVVKDICPHFDKLLKIKVDCMNLSMKIPSEIIEWEKKLGHKLEQVSSDILVKKESEKIDLSDCILEKYEKFISIDMTKVPKNITRIEFQYEEC